MALKPSVLNFAEPGILEYKPGIDWIFIRGSTFVVFPEGRHNSDVTVVFYDELADIKWKELGTSYDRWARDNPSKNQLHPNDLAWRQGIV